MVQVCAGQFGSVAVGMRKLIVSADGLTFACSMAARSEHVPEESRQSMSSGFASGVSAVVLTT